MIHAGRTRVWSPGSSEHKGEPQGAQPKARLTAVQDTDLAPPKGAWLARASGAGHLEGKVAGAGSW